MNRPIQVKPADSESRGGKRRPSLSVPEHGHKDVRPEMHLPLRCSCVLLHLCFDVKLKAQMSARRAKPEVNANKGSCSLPVIPFIYPVFNCNHFNVLIRYVDKCHWETILITPGAASG